MQDRGEKTEQPTPRRMEKARREGQFLSSRELLSAVQFLVFVAIVSHWGRQWLFEAARIVKVILVRAFRADLQVVGLITMLRMICWHLLAPLGVLGAGLVAATLAAQLSMTRMGFALKKLIPDLRRLSLASRLRDLLRQNLWSFFKAIVMLPLAMAAVYAISSANRALCLALPFMGVEAGFVQVSRSLDKLLWKAAGIFLAIGLADLFRQRRQYIEELRMSRQEVREEIKELEGNPHIKSRIRRLQRGLLRRRMMSNVRKATAVVVNPTHYAVALRYQLGAMNAPVVVAKGKNYLALRIRALAVEHEVPLVENPPLAQTLYASVEVGQEIPANLYQAVAEVLAYVYRVMNGKLPG
jgi:flagellar biosynthetic protein FlhB